MTQTPSKSRALVVTTASGHWHVMPTLAANGPIKRSVTIAGHETSISLEPVFWDGLRRAAADLELPVNALVARIDAERIAHSDPGNLASTIRVWLYTRQIENVSH